MSQPPAPPPPETLAAIWAARGIDAGAVAPDSTGTIGRSAVRIAETLAARPGALVRADEVAEALELGPVIGRGAMGVVRLATQTALKRTVAVKQVLDPTDEVVAALLREAWIAGNLEHPNILPIHALTASSRGLPLLVMKRIEGVPWSLVLTDPERVPGGERIDDPLEWHLRVLTRVCRAVHFAHARGVVHLDIKPDNVMLGRFGEVYLVDWGLAASFAPAERHPVGGEAPAFGTPAAEVPPWMPRASDIKVVVGTPAYMAPEQAIAAGDRIDARTDVYQLGAVLYEIITGQRLHTGSVMEAVGAAFQSAPPELPGVPQELATLCRKAVARDRGERFSTADALRQAIEAFLHHRHATALADEALEKLEAVETADESLQQRLLDECRFGLRLALRAWPDQPRAQAGWQRLLHLVAERHLARDELEAARAIATELSAPALTQRIEARVAALAAEEARLTALRQDRDLNLNRRQRLRWVGLLGVLWLVWNGACGLLHRSGWLELGYLHLFGLSAITLAAFAGGAWSVRRTLRRISVDRQIVDTLGAGLATVPLVWVGGALLDLPPLHAVALSMPLYVLFMAALALGVDRRMRKVPLALAHLAVLAAMVPEFAFEITGLAGFLSAIPAAVVWSRADAPHIG